MVRVLVTDFDGTICSNEFYKLVRERLLDKSIPDYWAEFRQGRMSHFAALQKFFSAIAADEQDVIGLLPEMNLDPRFADLAAQLVDSGWRIIVASAGCDWYIRQLLDPLGVPLVIHSNPGMWIGEGKGLEMLPPIHSPFFEPKNGIDRRKITLAAIQEANGEAVAFAGDGVTDVESALLVPSHLRFARGDCARALQESGCNFQPFQRWAEIAEALLGLES